MASSLEKLAKYRHHLHVLGSSPPSMQKAILKHADKDLVISLVEIFLNILSGNLAISAQSHRVLERYKTLLRRLAYEGVGKTGRPSSTQRGRGSGGRGGGGGAGRKGKPKEAEWVRKKRAYIVQKGCGAFLTSLITSALGGIVGKVIGQALHTEKPKGV